MSGFSFVGFGEVVSPGPTPTPSPTPMVNTSLPYIEGEPIDGTAWVYHAGIWTGPVDRFEITIIDALDNVLLVRQPFLPAPATYSVEALDKTIRLRIFALDADDNEQAATSLPFGPVVEAGEELIIALAFSRSPGVSLPSTPYPYTAVVGDAATSGEAVLNTVPLSSVWPVPNPNHPDLDWGFDDTTVVIGSVSSPGDSRVAGRALSTLSTMSTMWLSIELPEVGPGIQYNVYAGFGYNAASGVLQSEFLMREATTAGAILIDHIQLAGEVGKIRDATGVLRTVAEWQGLSDLGGAPFTITPTNTRLYIGLKDGVGGAVHLGTIAITRL